MVDPEPTPESTSKSKPSFFHLGLSGWVAIGSLAVGVVCLNALNNARGQIDDANRRVEQTVRNFEAEREANRRVQQEMERLVEKFSQLERQTRFEVDRGNRRIEGMEEELTRVRDTVVEMVRRERRREEATGTGTERPADAETAPPAEEAGAPPVQIDPTRVYKVVDGDNLYRISRKLGVTVKELLEANPTIDPNRLSIGQELRIPVIP